MQVAPPAAPALAASMSLFDLDAELQGLFEQAAAEEEEGGKVSEETESLIAQYFEATVSKVDRIAEFIKHLTLVDQAKKAEKARLDARYRAVENGVNRCRAMMVRFMSDRGLKQIKGRLNTVSLRDNTVDSLVIEDPEKVPDEFVVVPLLVMKPAFDDAMRAAATEGELCLTVGEFSVEIPRVDEKSLRVGLKSPCPSCAPPTEPGNEPCIDCGGTRIRFIPGARLERGQHIRIT